MNSLFKNIGHAVASFAIGVFNALTNRPNNGSIAQQVGAGAAQLLKIADPQAVALVNASVTGYGDIVQAAKAAGVELKAGQKLTIVVSDALESASKTVWPDIENVLSAFEGAIGIKPGPGAPAA